MSRVLSDVLLDVWSQVLLHDSNVVRLDSETFPVTTSKKKRLRQVYFEFDGASITGLEQDSDFRPRFSSCRRLNSSFANSYR
jgi:hypothetical protein